MSFDENIFFRENSLQILETELFKKHDTKHIQCTVFIGRNKCTCWKHSFECALSQIKKDEVRNQLKNILNGWVFLEE